MRAGSIKLTHRHTESTEIFDLTEELKGSHGGADVKILNDFFDICRSGGEPRSDLEDGRMSVRMALAARESTDNNRPTDIC